MPIVSNTQEHVREICAADMHTLSTSMLNTEQKQNIVCRKLASQLQQWKQKQIKVSDNVCKWCPTDTTVCY